MAAEIFYDDDADLSVIQGRKVAVIGYGSQGHAHSLSLRDSGVDVRIGLPEGSKSRAKARGAGARGRYARRGLGRGRRHHAARPGHRPAQDLRRGHRPSLTAGKALFFGHGLNIRYGLITPPSDVDVAMVAPKGPGHLVRRQFVDGKGVPVLVAVEQDADRQRVPARPVLRQGHRRHPGRRHPDHVQGGDRDRPLRRAGRPLRRRLGAGPGRLRGPDRGRLRPRDRLLRVPARAEAHRRPDVRGRHRPDAVLASPTPPSTATTPVARASSTPGSRTRCARSWARSSTASSPASGSPRTTPAVRTSPSGARRARRTRSRRPASKLRAMMSWVDRPITETA